MQRRLAPRAKVRRRNPRARKRARRRRPRAHAPSPRAHAPRKARPRPTIMGQKIHPTGFRIPTIEPWRSRWYAGKKDFKKFLLQDKKIRDHVAKEFGSAGIPRVEIERTSEA